MFFCLYHCVCRCCSYCCSWYCCSYCYFSSSGCLVSAASIVSYHTAAILVLVVDLALWFPNPPIPLAPPPPLSLMGIHPFRSESSAADMKETTSLTLKESAAFLAGNSYLRDVAILVIAYGTSINIVEGMYARVRVCGCGCRWVGLYVRIRPHSFSRGEGSID